MRIVALLLPPAWRSQLNRFLWPVLAIGIAIGLVLLAHPASAWQVRVAPTSPQLGDTVTVMMQSADIAGGGSPTVTINNKPYPAFAVAPNRFRSLVPTTPLDKPGALNLQIAGGQGVERLALKLKGRSFPVQRIWLPPGKDSSGTDYEFDRVDAFKKLVTPQKFWNGPFLKPSSGEITTIYGVRRYYNGVFAKDYFHRGVDYAAGVGSPVVAPAAGRVALVGREAQGFQIHGNTIGVDHGQGVASIFLHLSRINVKEGEFVQAGQLIGAIGATGAVTGPHLHWGLYVHGQSVDPVPWRTRGFE